MVFLPSFLFVWRQTIKEYTYLGKTSFKNCWFLHTAKRVYGTPFTCETKIFIQKLQVFDFFLMNRNFLTHFHLLENPASIFLICTEPYHFITSAMLIPTPDQLRIIPFLLFYPNSYSVLWLLQFLYWAFILYIPRPLVFLDKESFKDANL